MCHVPAAQVDTPGGAIASSPLILSSSPPPPLPSLLPLPSSSPSPSSWFLDNQEMKSTSHHHHLDLLVDLAGLPFGMVLGSLAKGSAGGRMAAGGQVASGEQGWTGRTAGGSLSFLSHVSEHRVLHHQAGRELTGPPQGSGNCSRSFRSFRSGELVHSCLPRGESTSYPRGPIFTLHREGNPGPWNRRAHPSSCHSLGLVPCRTRPPLAYPTPPTWLTFFSPLFQMSRCMFQFNG